MPDASLGADIALIRGARIYFGHHSVGNNILLGLSELTGDSSGWALRFHRISADAPLSDGALLADGIIGENTKPGTKCDAFARELERFGEAGPDIAIMKFCFIDFGQGMKAEEIFARYRATIDSLKTIHPKTVFIHVTAPLTARRTGVKEFIKTLLGRGDRFEADNIERSRFNHLLREHYRGQALYDLARVESTHPDGSPERFVFEGAEYEALAPEYTDDGGHLNRAGRASAARELIRVLGEALRTQQKNLHAALPKL